MSKVTLYNKNYTTPPSITDEVYSSVGSSSFILGDYKRYFKGDADLTIYTASGGGGTQLIEDTDYALSKNNSLSLEAGYDVFDSITIHNPTYQAIDLYINYYVVGSLLDASWANELRTDIDQNTSDIGLLSPPKGHLYGFKLEWASATTISVNAGECRDVSNSILIEQGAPRTLVITNSGAGGLDTGSVQANKFYYIWSIYNPTTSTAQVMFSLSRYSPTMPSGYTYKRRLRGAVLTDGSSNILGFTQTDEYFHFLLPIQNLSTGSPGTSKTNLTISVPPYMRADIRVIIFSSTTAYGYVMNVSDTDYTPTVTKNDWHVGSGNNRIAVAFQKLTTDSSSQIAYRHTVSSVTNFVIETIGFIDNAQD